MFGSSMVLTVGAALDRAHAEGMTVRLNVCGEWITGRIVNHDGHGVAVLEESGDICVFRSDAIAGVRIPGRVGQDARPAQQRRAPLEGHPVAV